MMYVYTVLQERGKRGGEKRRGKSVSRGRLHAVEGDASERGRVVRERDRVLARRLAVAVRAAGSPFIDGPEHDSSDLRVNQ